jgi:4-diphosphocytidyl-2-C-methyl-D-erythritol kinase
LIRYIEIKAPAKINIGLNIIEKRSDGYHNLLTLFYPIHDLYDKITIELADQFQLTCNNSLLEIDNTNLITRAKILMEQEFSKKMNVKVHLEKNIPMGAGMGGGSSDAAAVLLSLNDMFQLNASKNKLAELVLILGSDVPYFLNPVPAIGKSRGEILSPVNFNLNKPIVIINPGIHINTGEAFKNIKPEIPGYKYEEIFKSIPINMADLKDVITNDFEKYVFEKYPVIRDIKDSMYDLGAEFSLMTGTGSTVFGIFPDSEKAEKAVKIFPEEYFRFLSENI